MIWPARSRSIRAMALPMTRLSLMIFKTISLATAIAAASHLNVARAQTPDVQIFVHGIHFGGQVVYRYQVRNNTGATINRINLGVDDEGKDLPASPWKNNAALGEVPAEVPASQCKPFTGMRCLVAVYQFDYMTEPRALVSMRGMEASQTPPPAVFSRHELIRPGATSSFAELVVPQRASGYLTASGGVGFLDNPPKDSAGKPIVTAQVPFTRIDMAPPGIVGSAEISRAGGMLDVRVNLSVSDNFDPAPEVVLVSITANEPLRANDVRAEVGTDSRVLQLKRNKGRVYYLTYRATDGSDNSASTVISVPGTL